MSELFWLTEEQRERLRPNPAPWRWAEKVGVTRVIHASLVVAVDPLLPAALAIAIAFWL